MPLHPGDDVRAWLLIMVAVGVAVVVAVGVLVGVLLGLRVARWLRGLASRTRNRVAQQGESDAEAILARAGYRVIERQAIARWSMSVDGEEVPVDVRVDLLVQRRGRRYVAEVKTGDRAPDPTHPPTRRQLLEYALVFDAREVLLVDVPSGHVRAIAFPTATRS
ncbi:MAG: hypothetical protein HYV09_21815 [Deltaproteobacteria bacterium]|nr:hypothetical protein [Deltaproteobacteria bacterium]